MLIIADNICLSFLKYLSLHMYRELTAEMDQNFTIRDGYWSANLHLGQNTKDCTNLPLNC